MKSRNIHIKLLRKSMHFALIVVWASGLFAQSRKYTKELTIGSSNDFFVWFSHTDRFYTYGIHTDYKFVNAPQSRLSRVFKPESLSFTKIGFNIQAYTPDYLHTEGMYQNRPYAGWSYFEMMLNNLRETSTFSFGLELGILGPHSYAGNIQNWFHREFTGDPELDGWDNQLGDFLGINLRLDYFKPLWKAKMTEISLEVRNSLGNIFMYSEPGVVFRFGKLNPIHLSAATGNRLLSRTNTSELFLGVGVFTKFSAYNATLQGDIFEDDSIFRQNEINNLILNARANAVWAYDRFTIIISYHLSDGEFNNGDQHQYMRIAGSYQFD